LCSRRAKRKATDLLDFRTGAPGKRRLLPGKIFRRTVNLNRFLTTSA
jgi:hypothetical protein